MGIVEFTKDFKWFDESWWRAKVLFPHNKISGYKVQASKNQANLISSMSFGQNCTELCTVRLKTNINNIFEWFINGIYYNVQ